jgi:hypothetical protein
VIRGISQEMIAATKLKYHNWDKFMSRKWLENGTPEQQNRVYLALRDPTVYGYAFMKDPRNLSKPFKLYPYQDTITNDYHPRVVFCAANQIGKSITLDLKGLTYALNNPGKTVLMTSRTLPQAKDLLRQIRNFLQNSSLDYQYDIGDTETKTEIYFRHHDLVTISDDALETKFKEYKKLPQSRIICVPATEAALGYAVDLALVDELFFYDNGEHFYKQILQPRTYTTKGQIVVFSNPNGQQGVGWEIWNDPRFHRYEFNFLDCPTNTRKEFDALIPTLTREQIDSTLLAKFTSPEGGFLTLGERKKMQEERPSMIPSLITSPIYVFYDWGKVRDRTVRVIAVPVKKGEHDWADEVYVHEMKEYPQGTKYSDIVDDKDNPDSLVNLIKNVGIANVAMVGWDNTGVGQGIEDFIKRVEQLGIQAMPVSFDLANKSRIYTLFKLLAEQGRIKVPYIKECDKQLSMLRFKRTSRGHLQVHHENEKDRDDYPDAIAGLTSIIIQPENPPISVTIV